MSAEKAKSQARQRLTEIGVDRELDLTEQAAVSRQNIPKHLRRPCYAYIDEFQDFAANPGSVKSLAQILSKCRKFGLHLTLAHQNLSQVSERMLGALGNIQTHVFFGISWQDAEWFAREVGYVDSNSIKQQPQTPSQHPIFVPLIEQWERWITILKQLPSRQALAAGYDGVVKRVWTIPVAKYQISKHGMEDILLIALRKHAISQTIPNNTARLPTNEMNSSKISQVPPRYDASQPIG